jgi:prepilin-type N-terminal cleavage/methylation domain-containing protein
MKQNKKLLNNSRGFTLIEVMVSLFILSVVGISIFVQTTRTEVSHRELLYTAYAREVAMNYVNELSLSNGSAFSSRQLNKNFGGISFLVNSTLEPYNDKLDLLILNISTADRENIYTLQTLHKKR